MQSLYNKAFYYVDNTKPAYLGIYFSLFLHLSILLFAIGLFPAMLATFGPEGKSGSIKHILCHNGCPWKRNSKKKKEGGVE